MRDTVVFTFLIFYIIIITLSSVSQAYNVTRLENVISKINEPYKNNYKRNEIKNLVDSINNDLLSNSMNESKLQNYMSIAESIGYSYDHNKYYNILIKYIKILIILSTPIILYFLLDIIPCTINYILKRRLSRYVGKRS